MLNENLANDLLTGTRLNNAWKKLLCEYIEIIMDQVVGKLLYNTDINQNTLHTAIMHLKVISQNILQELDRKTKEEILRDFAVFIRHQLSHHLNTITQTVYVSQAVNFDETLFLKTKLIIAAVITTSEQTPLFFKEIMKAIYPDIPICNDLNNINDFNSIKCDISAWINNSGIAKFTEINTYIDIKSLENILHVDAVTNVILDNENQEFHCNLSMEEVDTHSEPDIVVDPALAAMPTNEAKISTLDIAITRPTAPLTGTNATSHSSPANNTNKPKINKQGFLRRIIDLCGKLLNKIITTIQRLFGGVHKSKATETPQQASNQQADPPVPENTDPPTEKTPSLSIGNRIPSNIYGFFTPAQQTYNANTIAKAKTKQSEAMPGMEKSKTLTTMHVNR